MSKIISYKKFLMPSNPLPVSDSNPDDRIAYLKRVASIITENTSLKIMDDLDVPYPYTSNVYVSNIYLGFEGDPIPKIELGNYSYHKDSDYSYSVKCVAIRAVFFKADESAEGETEWNTHWTDPYNMDAAAGCVNAHTHSTANTDTTKYPSTRVCINTSSSTNVHPIIIHILKMDDSEIITFQGTNKSSSHFSLVITNVLDKQNETFYKTIIFFKSICTFTSYITELKGTSFTLDSSWYPPDTRYDIFNGSTSGYDGPSNNCNLIDVSSDILINCRIFHISNRLSWNNKDLYYYSNKMDVEPGEVIKIGENRYYCLCVKWNTRDNSNNGSGHKACAILIKLEYDK